MPTVYICDAVQSVRELHADLLTPIARSFPIAEQLERQATRLLAGQRSGHAGAVVQLSNWHPDHVGNGEAEILASELSPDDARLSLAREYGFPDWAAVQAIGTDKLDPAFERAVDALVLGDLALLQHCLDEQPDLILARSRFGHQATLLHYIAANGCETFRQCVPNNLEEVCDLLLVRGADVNAHARIYGESTALGLLLSSAHPAAAGVVDSVAALLRSHGAT